MDDWIKKLQACCNETRGGTTALAKASGISRQYISDVKNGRVSGSEKLRLATMKYLDDIHYEYKESATEVAMLKKELESAHQRIVDLEGKIESQEKLIAVMEKIINLEIPQDLRKYPPPA
jgi:transcriptional regulator with XRE-family HTH domain